MNKIVELKINPEVELLGFDAVALVEQPAIEENFYAFNSVDVDSLIVEELLKQELFVERIPGESRDSYLGRCIPKMLNEGYPEDQSIAICYEGLALDCPPATRPTNEVGVIEFTESTIFSSFTVSPFTFRTILFVVPYL